MCEKRTEESLPHYHDIFGVKENLGIMLASFYLAAMHCASLFGDSESDWGVIKNKKILIMSLLCTYSHLVRRGLVAGWGTSFHRNPLHAA